jgi:D-amino-acid dehydrogenase
VPLLDIERRFVTARLGPERLRIAGLAEFAGHDLGIDRGRLDLLRRGAADLLPRLAARIRSAEPNAWTGLRPMTPDGPPLIGPTPIEGLHLNAGHGAMGWTQGCGSAELAADLVLGNTPAIDPAGLLAERWLGR